MKRLILLGMILFSTHAFSLNYKNNDLLNVSTAFIAKEVCSCFFVEKNTLKFCQQKYKEDFSYLRRINIKKRSVTVSYFGILYKKTSVFKDERRGCILK